MTTSITASHSTKPLWLTIPRRPQAATPGVLTQSELQALVRALIG